MNFKRTLSAVALTALIPFAAMAQKYDNFETGRAAPVDQASLKELKQDLSMYDNVMIDDLNRYRKTCKTEDCVAAGMAQTFRQYFAQCCGYDYDASVRSVVAMMLMGDRTVWGRIKSAGLENVYRHLIVIATEPKLSDARQELLKNGTLSLDTVAAAQMLVADK